MMIEQNTNYAQKLSIMDYPTFDKVRELANDIVIDLPKQQQDELYEALNRGVDVLDTEPQMAEYLYSFGLMHQAKLNYAFGKLPKDILWQNEINIVDYGCGQAMGVMCYSDYLRANGYSQKVNTITLIEPSEICLKRAALHASVFFPEAEIITVNKGFDELSQDNLICHDNAPTLHIFSNVLDIQDFDLLRLANLISNSIKGYNQFICIGPFFGFADKDNRIKDFCSLVNGNDYFFKTFDKYEFDPNKSWTCELSIFAKGNGIYYGKELSPIHLSKDLFGLLNDIQKGTIKELPLEYQFLNDYSADLIERKNCMTIIAEKLRNKNLLNCEEVTVVDYGCGQGLASISLLGWLRNANYDLGRIKCVKLVDKDRNMLEQASILYAKFFPNIKVETYEQDLLNKQFFIESDCVLTINIFSYILADISLYEEIERVILKSHSLFIHNIILDEIAAKNKCRKGIKTHYFDYVINRITDYTGCDVWEKSFLETKSRGGDGVPTSVYKYAIASRTTVPEIKIPNVENKYSGLCPGEPRKNLENVPSRILWFEQPLDKSKYCENLDDYNKISLEEDHISPYFDDLYDTAGLNPHSIKVCAEKFYQGHIYHALSCGMQCGDEIVAVYKRAAEDGITEAYNNLGVLQFLDKYEDEVSEQKGVDYFNLAANGGSEWAMINLATHYMEKGDIDLAYSYYNAAAKIGNTVALLNLAITMNFGLYEHRVDLDQAEELYRRCLDECEKEKNQGGYDDVIQSICCLNLILLLFEKGEHYVRLLDVFYQARKPSHDLKYCKEILQIIYTRRFSKSINDILHLTKSEEQDKPYVTFNRALFIYNGLNLPSFNVEIRKDVDKAIDTLQSLVDNIDDILWDDKRRYIYPFYASWLNRHRKGLNGKDLEFWKKDAEINPNRACASMTNSTHLISDEEIKKSIWRKYAYSDGCKTCHECYNYNTSLRVCPKAQYYWATTYEDDCDEKEKLIRLSAEQQYDRALYYLGFRKAIQELSSSIKEDWTFNLLPDVPPEDYKQLFPTLAKDNYFNYLQLASEINERRAQCIIPFVSELRGNKYNYLYWLCIFDNIRKHEETKRKIFDYFKTKCNKTLYKYFIPRTLCEKQMLSSAEDIVKITDDFQFICSYAAFLLDGDKLEEAKELYVRAKEKGCSGIEDILEDIDRRILEKKNRRRHYDYDDYDDYYDDHDWMQDTWDAMTDGMYGDMPEGFDGDFDFLGY